MYIGEIPGMYFDKERQKYFSIQADRNSVSSSGKASKYSKSQVLREERLVKRQKTQDDHRSRARIQTVNHAAALRHPLIGGAGLYRELSQRPYAHSHAQRSEAVLGALQAKSSRVSDSDGFVGRITHMQDIPDANVTVLIRQRGDRTRTTTYIGGQDWFFPTRRRRQQQFQLPTATNTETCVGEVSALACTMQGNKVFFVRCDRSASWTMDTLEYDGEPGTDPRSVLRAGDDRFQQRLRQTTIKHQDYGGHSLVDVKFQPESPGLSWAMAGSEGVGVYDMERIRRRINIPDISEDIRALFLKVPDDMEATSISWLDPRTLAIAVVPFPKDSGMQQQRQYTSRQHITAGGQPHGRRRRRNNHSTPIKPVHLPDHHSEVRLWDIRSNDSSTRILPSARLTGLSTINLPSTPLNPSAAVSPNPHLLLTASTSAISLFDLRFTKSSRPSHPAPLTPPQPTTTPLLTIPHATQTPQLPLAVNSRMDMLAAVDRDGHMQVYSLRTGSCLRTLLPGDEGGGPSPLGGGGGAPRWTEGSWGAPYLQVCGAEGWVYSWIVPEEEKR